MTQTNERPIVGKQAPIPTTSNEFRDGWIRGTDWYHSHEWSGPIDSKYVLDNIRSWGARGLLDGKWNDELEWHVAFILAMVTEAVTDNCGGNGHVS